MDRRELFFDEVEEHFRGQEGKAGVVSEQDVEVRMVSLLAGRVFSARCVADEELLSINGY